MKLRARNEDDLDACELLARTVHTVDGYPPRFADDLRLFVAAQGALGAWVAESDRVIVGHVALQSRSSQTVMALASEATGWPPDRLCVVTRLFVSPSERRRGIGGSLLEQAAEAGLARGLRPILDVATHFQTAIRLYEQAGWTCAGQVTVRFDGEEALEELVYLGPAPARVDR